MKRAPASAQICADAGVLFLGGGVDEWLTASQRRLIQLVASGLSNREIARRLDRSPATVRNRLTRIYAFTGAQSRAQLVCLAIGRGWVDPAAIAVDVEARAARVAAANREIRRRRR